ncbi:class I SAM-dependent methyltransferase [Dactylosporangium sp. AC04546]|uniref:class I SAM-dependent methyltransferase n=1 Tax=Dactylosporangium sp. AC04546 TaxID=2862460 RepID=UPI001EE10288|nr:class I SAM-dependent methyltransferase [Dactylosporangium sp. AC04546]WVK87434.1 class I SAM-dependent methyltransferase [Dactylosporangium sp. AC04546]
MPIQPHRARQVAESFGVDAERYDRTRPAYPDELITKLVATEVLDVGCGTGTAARQLRRAGCAVLGVEPDERMAAFARRTGVDVEVATFEDWAPAGRTFDAVVAGTAWHWIDPAVGAEKAAAVLRPGGRFAAFWHSFQAPAAVADAFAEAFRAAVPDAPFDPRGAAAQGPDPYRPILDRTAEGLRATGAFGEPEEWRFAWERTYTRDEWLDQLPTSGALTRLPAEALTGILAAAGTAIDAMGGAFTLPYTTIAVTATRS